MLTLVHRTRREDRLATEDRVILADGSIVIVPRANLVAAKALLAAEKAAQRRMEANLARETGEQQRPIAS